MRKVKAWRIETEKDAPDSPVLLLHEVDAACSSRVLNRQYDEGAA